MRSFGASDGRSPVILSRPFDSLLSLRTGSDGEGSRGIGNNFACITPAEAIMATEVATQWTEDVDPALAESKKTNKAVLLDFTAAPM